MGQRGFWDVEDRQQGLAKKKSLLVELNALVPWETFVPILEQIHQKPRKSNAGRKPVNALVLFKMLISRESELNVAMAVS